MEQGGLVALDATVAFVGRSMQRTEVKRAKSVKRALSLRSVTGC